MIQSRVEASCGSVGLLLFYVIGNSLESPITQKGIFFFIKKERLGQKTSGRKD